MWDPGAIAWVAVAALVLVHAALCDVRSREVPDIHWWVLGIAGPVLCAVSSWGDGEELSVILRLVGSLILAVCLMWEGAEGWRAATLAIPAAIVTVAPAIAYGDPVAWSGVSSLVMFLLFYGMYLVGLLKGGADAKCLMVLALAFPVYPEVLGAPLLWDIPHPESLVVNPSFSVMVLALVISLLGCLPVAARNIRSGDMDRRLLTSYRMDAEEAEKAFVWRLEDEADSEGKVRVTPMVPFVLPLAISFLIVAVLGTPLALLFSARC